MIERGTIRLNIERGAAVTEFTTFLQDLEDAYLAVYSLPSLRDWRHGRRRFPFPPEFYEVPFLQQLRSSAKAVPREDAYPLDQLEITKLKIESPGFIELLASFSPLQQLREYLKDRHERTKDREWRSETEKSKALMELDILRIQYESSRIGAIKEFHDLLKDMHIDPEERDIIIWEKIGVPLSKLGRHQDSALLGSQDDDIDGRRD